MPTILGGNAVNATAGATHSAMSAAARAIAAPEKEKIEEKAVFHVCVVSCVLSDRGWGSIPQRLWRDGSPSWSVSGRCPPRRGLRVLALQVRSSRPAVPFIPSCPGPLARTPGGYLAVVAPCRDGLDAGSVLGHHLVTAARGGAHLRARVVNKNQTDREKGGRVLPVRASPTRSIR